MDGATTWPVQGHPGQPATLGIAPLALPTAPSRAGREPYLAFGDPEAHVGLHAGGSATAPWEPRGPGVSSSSCSSSWDLRDGWRGRRRQAGRGGGAGGVPRPRRARVLCRVPKPARSLLCHHAPAPGTPSPPGSRMLLSASSWVPEHLLLGVTTFQAPKSHTSTRTGPASPALPQSRVTTMLRPLG